MVLYLLVVGFLLGPCEPSRYRTVICPASIDTPTGYPRIDFFLSQDTAAKEYAAAPKGSARLFKIEAFLWVGEHTGKPVSCKLDATGQDCEHFRVKELNVLPAQSYEVSDKEKVEARP